MKQCTVTKQEAYDELNKQIVNARKDMNQECLKRTHVPLPLINRAINLARVEDLVYKDGDE